MKPSVFGAQNRPDLGLARQPWNPATPPQQGRSDSVSKRIASWDSLSEKARNRSPCQSNSFAETGKSFVDRPLMGWS